MILVFLILTRLSRLKAIVFSESTRPLEQNNQLL